MRGVCFFADGGGYGVRGDELGVCCLERWQQQGLYAKCGKGRSVLRPFLCAVVPIASFCNANLQESAAGYCDDSSGIAAS